VKIATNHHTQHGGKEVEQGNFQSGHATILASAGALYKMRA
jgi:hypothetical protein